MCGRDVSPDIAAIERQWHIGGQNNNPFRGRFNVLPTTQVPVIRCARDADELELIDARWGLIPHWWSKPKLPTSTINARSEEAAGKPMWRFAYRQARWLIPAVGWYEWKPMERVEAATGELRTYKQPLLARRWRGARVLRWTDVHLVGTGGRRAAAYLRDPDSLSVGLDSR